MDEDLKEMALDELTTFNSSYIYIVLQTSEDNALLEGAVYIWVGSELSQWKDGVQVVAYKARKFIGTTSKTVYVSINADCIAINGYSLKCLHNSIDTGMYIIRVVIKWACYACIYV